MSKVYINLNSLKETKKREVSAKFNQKLSNLELTSSLGFVVNNRKNNTKDDLRNIECLLEVSKFPILFRDANNEFHEIDYEQCLLLKKEMQKQILDLYNKKWELEKIISESNSVEEIINLKIEF